MSLLLIHVSFFIKKSQNSISKSIRETEHYKDIYIFNSVNLVVGKFITKQKGEGGVGKRTGERILNGEIRDI